MPDKNNKWKAGVEPKEGRPSTTGTSFTVDVEPVNFRFEVGQVEVTVIQVDSIRVEDSTNRKYLILPSGALACRQSVFITLPDGRQHELTTDVLPEQYT